MEKFGWIIFIISSEANQFQREKRNQRNQKISTHKKSLESELTKPSLSYIAFFSQDFDSFLFLFQIDEPLVHMLYQKMGKLLFNFSNKFRKNGSIYEESITFPKSISDLMNIYLTLQRAQKSSRNTVIGPKTKLLLTESSLLDFKNLTFSGECLKFYAAAVAYL